MFICPKDSNVSEFRPTHTSESLCSVAISDSDHQGEEVDFAEPPDGPLHQTAAAAGGDGAAAQRPA